MRIFFVPGHGGHDPGVVGLGGLKEADVAYRIAEACVNALRGTGHVCKLSRKQGEYLSPSRQARASDAFLADVTVAIHLNGSESRAARGYEIFTTRGATRSDSLATEMFNLHERQFPDVPHRKDMTDGDPDKESNFSVLMCASPAVLVECDFLSNPEVEATFIGQHRVLREADAIVDGVLRWIRKGDGR